MAYLVLSNGAVFEGSRIGANKTVSGEMVFSTELQYLKTLTNPDYSGKIVIQTFPLVGNHGVIKEESCGECSVGGYIVREICDTPSNFRSEGDLDTYLKDNGVCGISGVDTRELTRIIREEGTVSAIICDEIPKDFPQKPAATSSNTSEADKLNILQVKKALVIFQ